MTWIMPESDREGKAVCQFWLQGSKHNGAPTEKRIRPLRAPLGTYGPPPSFREKGGDSKLPENSLKQTKRTNLARRKRSQRYLPLPPLVLLYVSCQLEGRDL